MDVLIQQATAFNIVGRIFAPRYRQCSAGIFFDDSPDKMKLFAEKYGFPFP